MTFSEYESAASEPVPAAPTFWQSASLEELAAAQGVEPVDDLDEISHLWPADDDADMLVNHILHERAARRAGR